MTLTVAAIQLEKDYKDIVNHLKVAFLRGVGEIFL